MNGICDINLCTSCKACLNICPHHCISMVIDDLDTPYPKIDESKCVECNLCRKVCPNNKNLIFYQPRKVLAAWSLDEKIRRISASGGVAAELYKFYLERGGYSAGVEIDRHIAKYILIDKIEDIKRVQNSKYVYSDTDDIFLQIREKLELGKKVLFVGLPCQVAGLLCFLQRKYDNLTTVDIVCHGVVPNEYLRQHIELIENKAKRKASHIFFRDPDYHTYTYTFTLIDNGNPFYKKKVYEDDVYQLGYHKALIYRENCYNCKYAQQKRIGDLTICDFSGIGMDKPVAYDKLKVSCVLVNTQKGEKLIYAVKDQLFTEERPEKEAFDFEPQLNHPYSRHVGRQLFVRTYTKNHNFSIAAKKALSDELNEYRHTHPNAILGLYKKIHLYSFLIQRKFARLLHCQHISIGGCLMLHRIDSPDSHGIWYNQHLKLSPQTIEKMISYARKKKCKFVSIDEMEEAIRKKKDVRRWISITFDDGYRDNYINGTPLFRKLNVPYTIYVCTKMVKGEMLYWWELLEQMVLNNDEVILKNGHIFDCSTKEKKEQAFLDIREIILNLPQDDLEDRLRDLFNKYDVSFDFGNKDLGLTWNQIKELSKDPLATIGNHTYSHLAFTGCSDEGIYADIEHAAQEMRNKTGLEMSHFAFPFGEATAVSQHDVELVKRFGFKTSATTKDGLVCYGTDPLELPRIFVTEKNWKQVIDRIVANC